MTDTLTYTLADGSKVVHERVSSFERTVSPAQSYNEKRKAAFIPGSDYHATEEAFAMRIARANKRRLSGLKRSLWSDTKANRKAYGVPSANFKFTPAATDNTSGDLPPWTAAWPAAVLEAEDLRKEGA